MKPAEAVLDRARKLGYPPIVLAGVVRGSAASWWGWSVGAPPAEIEEAHRQLDALEKRGAR